MRKRPTTIKDIAKALEISVSTVSRALRDTYDVSARTRKAVLEKAAELNYKPNFNATGLVSSSTHNIGILLPAIANYYFSTVITGVQEVAYANGYNIILYVTNDSPQRELDIVRGLSVSNLDGILACTSSDSEEHFAGLMEDGIPVVFFDRVARNIPASKVMQDDFNGAFAAVEHLINNGYRKIAHIAGPAGMSLTGKRLQGYLQALKKHGIAVRREWIIYSGFSTEDGNSDTLQLLALADRPDAIFAANDRKATGAILALKESGIPIGPGIGVVGFTNDPVSSLISPSLTTVAEPAFEIGRKSCELLIRHIRNPDAEPEEFILPTHLMIRESSVRTRPEAGDQPRG